MPPKFFLLFTLFFPSSRVRAAPDPTVSAALLSTLLSCQDAYYGMDFDQADKLAEQALQQAPQHPLPALFKTGALLARLQDEQEAGKIQPSTLERFKAACQSALDLSQARLTAGQDAPGYLYLGTALGARGLVQLYQGHYLSAYGDGKRADAALQEALRRDPGLEEAYVGVGQYAYYCGRFSGLLRLILNLKGDTKQGIAWLERCAQSSSYASTAAAFTLTRIYALEEPDYPRAAFWLKPLIERYPRNPDLQSYAYRTVLGLGAPSPLAQSLLASASTPWDQGWRPPAYVPTPDPRSLRQAGAVAQSQSPTAL